VNATLEVLPFDTVYFINSIKLIEDTEVINRTKFLKVKLKTLAEEARIIRKEELRTNNNLLREQLYLHRIHVVRKAARSTHIAYGLLRGHAYKDMERSCDKYNKPDWKVVGDMIKKYGAKEQYQEFLDKFETLVC